MPAQDGIAFLREDHRAVKKLFKEFSATGDRAYAQRRRLADRIITELSIHAGIEENVLYPRARVAVPKSNDDVLEALEEHHVVKTILAELEKMQPSDERFAPKMKVLIENVKHHIDEEESELFPKLRKAFSREDLIVMGEDMRAAKRVMPTRPHPTAPDEPPGSITAAVVSAPVDAARKTVGAAVRRGRKAVAGVVDGSGR
ncbi:MAG: hemerythrin domain-containing protein [Candidatus Dormibacteraeota bacterium]|uniref:Hemerythrin n=1 Tax=Candidatus Aeolococcus gillhamiae TaxID=3127015 RepID=A0A2W6AYH8_9BACT|nr:hemerythrin domain-containing protein [Candidatus Dormibacteraeota bacterium]PZR83061.1 MAG: hemerythrin [Candidatus Dormibacter sp. RRmetagenome_bin12]